MASCVFDRREAMRLHYEPHDHVVKRDMLEYGQWPVRSRIAGNEDVVANRSRPRAGAIAHTE